MFLLFALAQPALANDQAPKDPSAAQPIDEEEELANGYCYNPSHLHFCIEQLPPDTKLPRNYDERNAAQKTAADIY